jgi:hypothetical protein
MNTFHASHHAKQLLVQELVVLCGSDQLNLVQWIKELHEMSLPELAKLKRDVLADPGL